MHSQPRLNNLAKDCCPFSWTFLFFNELNKLCDHFYFKQARFCVSLFSSEKQSLYKNTTYIFLKIYIYIIFSCRKGRASLTWSNSPPGPVDEQFW